jgi:hypothetical protein
MLVYKFKDGEEQLKSKPEEILISEFEGVLQLQVDFKGNFIDFYTETFKILGLSDELLDDIDFDNLSMIIKDWKDEFKMDDFSFESPNLLKTIVIGERVYKAYDEVFKLKSKDASLIQDFIVKNQVKHIAELLAVIFKDVSLGDNEHYDAKHIEYKSKLIRENVKLNVAYPYAMMVWDKFNKNLSNLNVLS